MDLEGSSKRWKTKATDGTPFRNWPNSHWQCIVNLVLPSTKYPGTYQYLTCACLACQGSTLCFSSARAWAWPAIVGALWPWHYGISSQGKNAHLFSLPSPSRNFFSYLLWVISCRGLKQMRWDKRLEIDGPGENEPLAVFYLLRWSRASFVWAE